MPQYEKRNRSDYSNLDLACTRCRERKIRCGRERPQCRNCAREEGVACVYQTPVKRVNHLKLLCDGVEQLQDRLSTIESHLGRLSLATSSPDHDGSSSPAPVRQASASQRASAEDEEDEDEDSSDEDEDEDGTACQSPQTDGSTELHVFHNQVDMVDCYHGPSSLFVLCNHFRVRALEVNNTTSPGATGLQDTLQKLCEVAGATELFPSYNDQSLVHLLPKQQVITAISHFLQRVDCATDIFVPSNLLTNLERVYSQPTKPGDDAWAVCFKAITLLVLGMEISAQESNALFGDFARSCLPSRAALVNSRLLNTPRLINVQTLILLSVAAQQFDPPGWAEHIFTHACMLARTMGLHHAPLLPRETSSDEMVERAKVLRSLYARDKSLCTMRGSISWLPSDDSKIASQVRAAVERQAPYSNRLRLAMIQDDVYRLSNAASRRRPSSASHTTTALQAIEKKLDQCARDLAIFDSVPSSSSCQSLLQLEFLATRILALQHGSEPRHVDQLRSDARASCLLLLIAHGDHDIQDMDTLKTLTSPKAMFPTRNEDLPASTTHFANVFDAFPVPAFFMLLEGLLQPAESDEATHSTADRDLLRRVSACYTKNTGRAQSNSHHRNVALIFEQLLSITEHLRRTHQQPSRSDPVPAPVTDMIPSNPGPHAPTLKPPTRHPPNISTNLSPAALTNPSFCPPTASVAEMIPSNPTLQIPPLDPSTTTSSTSSTDLSHRDLSSSSVYPPQTASTSSSWDGWFSGPSPVGLHASSGGPSSVDASGRPTADLPPQMLGSSQYLLDCLAESAYWGAAAPKASSPRKRRRTQEERELPLEKNMQSPLSDFLVSNQETPFHHIPG